MTCQKGQYLPGSETRFQRKYSIKGLFHKKRRQNTRRLSKVILSNGILTSFLTQLKKHYSFFCLNIFILIQMVRIANTDLSQLQCL